MMLMKDLSTHRRNAWIIFATFAVVAVLCTAARVRAQMTYSLTWFSKDGDMYLKMTDNDLKGIFSTDNTVISWNKAELAVYLATDDYTDSVCKERVSAALDAVLAEIRANLIIRFARTPDPQEAHIIFDASGEYDAEYRLPSRIRANRREMAIQSQGAVSSGSAAHAFLYNTRSSTTEFAYLYDRSLCRDGSDVAQRNVRWDIKRAVIFAVAPEGPNYDRVPRITASEPYILASGAPAVKLFERAGLRPGQRMREHWQDYVTAAMRYLSTKQQ